MRFLWKTIEVSLFFNKKCDSLEITADLFKTMTDKLSLFVQNLQKKKINYKEKLKVM